MKKAVINLQNLYSKNAEEKFGTAKMANAISKKNPKALYPDFVFLRSF